MSNFTDLSIKLTKTLNNKTIKEEGIYFTPQSIIHKNLDIIKKQTNLSIKTILEPSCGSCEYISLLNNEFKESSIVGIENNETIYETIKHLYNTNSNIKLIKQSYLDVDNPDKYDLIIGNPPYFVIVDKKEQTEKTKDKAIPKDKGNKYYKSIIDNIKTKNKLYKSYYDGRANMFILFILHSLNKLNNNGILSFILPVNFINCLYYQKLRKYIYYNYKIIDIINCNSDKYLETQQDTIIFIIQNCNNLSTLDKDINRQTNNNTIIQNNDKFSICKNNYTIFNTNENIIKLNKLYEGNTKTLNELNFKVSIGSIVWNQCTNYYNKKKTESTETLETPDTPETPETLETPEIQKKKSILFNANEYTENDGKIKTRLIYNSDIVNKQLVFKKYNNEHKKNYINKEGTNEPLLVLNRGYGKGKYKLDYCLINEKETENYLIENHLMCIKHTTEKDKKKLIELYNEVMTSFNNPKTNEFIELYFGNNAINTTELQHIVPIFS